MPNAAVSRMTPFFFCQAQTLVPCTVYSLGNTGGPDSDGAGVVGGVEAVAEVETTGPGVGMTDAFGLSLPQPVAAPITRAPATNRTRARFMPVTVTHRPAGAKRAIGRKHDRASRIPAHS